MILWENTKHFKCDSFKTLTLVEDCSLGPDLIYSYIFYYYQLCLTLTFFFTVALGFAASLFTFANVYSKGSLLQISNETTSSNQLPGNSKLCRCKIT